MVLTSHILFVSAFPGCSFLLVRVKMLLQAIQYENEAGGTGWPDLGEPAGTALATASPRSSVRTL